MSVLWDDSSAIKATNGKGNGHPWHAKRVEIDSRKVKDGDLFIALKGENFDGHEFITDAFAKGAACAMVQQDIEYNKHPLLIVEDCYKALDALGNFARARSSAKIVGITGSVGKTSTKEMVKLVLSAHGQTHATSGNYNNHIGTPLNLANLAEDVPYAVFEMGMNHAGEIAHLTKMVKPHIAIITNVEAVHLEFFDSVDAIASAKAEIFEGMQGGIAIVNADNRYCDFLKQAALAKGCKQVITCGQAEGANCRLLDYKSINDGAEIKADIFGKTVRFVLKTKGRHWAMTSLFALATTYALGLDVRKSALALAHFEELAGRGRVINIPAEDGEAMLVDDSYNASPVSMRAAFAKTAELWKSTSQKGRKIAVLGDMLELGKESESMHAMLAEDLQTQGFNKVFTAGSHMQALHNALPAGMRAEHVSDAAALLPKLKGHLYAGDVVLIKGSHGSKMHTISTALMASEEHKHAV